MGGKRILIAEDDIGIQTSLYYILKDQGHTVLRAGDGLEALDRLDEAAVTNQKVDLLVTDIQMPRMTGLGLIEELARRKVRLPVVVITGYGDKETLVKLLRLGCDDFLDKPFMPDDVRRKVGEVLEKHEQVAREESEKQATLIEQNLELSQQLEAYQASLSRIKSEVDSAVGSYRNLISVAQEGYRVGFSFLHQPFRDLGGDYLDIRDTATGCDVLVADVAGHDMSASYHTVLIKAFFDENVRTGNNGEEFFRILNHSLLESGRNERMVTAAFLRIDLDAMTAEAVSAGHPKIIRLRRKVPVAGPVHTRGSVLGLTDDLVFETNRFSVAPGDRLFLYTDGLINAHYVDGPTGVRHTLGEHGLDDLINDTASLPLKEQLQAVWMGVLRFCRQKQSDDMLLAGVEIPGADRASGGAS